MQSLLEKLVVLEKGEGARPLLNHIDDDSNSLDPRVLQLYKPVHEKIQTGNAYIKELLEEKQSDIKPARMCVQEVRVDIHRDGPTTVEFTREYDDAVCNMVHAVLPISDVSLIVLGYVGLVPPTVVELYVDAMEESAARADSELGHAQEFQARSNTRRRLVCLFRLAVICCYPCCWTCPCMYRQTMGCCTFLRDWLDR